MRNRSTSLRRRMIVGSALLVCGIVATGVGSVMTVDRLRQDFGVATDGYRQLRQLFGVLFLVSRARQAMGQTPPATETARGALRAAKVQLADRTSESVDGPPPRWVDESARVSCLSLLDRADGELGRGSTAPAVDLLFARLSQTTGDVRRSIADATAAADRRRRQAVVMVSVFGSVTALTAIIVTVGQYRRVMRPMDRLAEGARAIAGGEYDRPIEAGRDREFSALADDFNAMAEQLRAVHRGLEQEVADKSRELVRAGRLADVGYLAAGVAHEINNPLGIIAGYAERALRKLPADNPAHRPLSVICEQAFRCKQITDKLLSLARPAPVERVDVSAADVARDVVATVGGLGKRRLTVRAESAGLVSANPVEFNQVVLNLVVNAVEATDPESGEVVVDVRTTDHSVEVSVSDNGKGMSAETAARAFEPFFTDNRGHAGTGLGLSIVRSIVVDHGGSVSAHSDGPGRGSRFVVTLPAAGVRRD